MRNHDRNNRGKAPTGSRTHTTGSRSWPLRARKDFRSPAGKDGVDEEALVGLVLGHVERVQTTSAIMSSEIWLLRFMD
jgi:hypothetical protein